MRCFFQANFSIRKFRLKGSSSLSKVITCLQTHLMLTEVNKNHICWWLGHCYLSWSSCSRLLACSPHWFGVEIVFGNEENKKDKKRTAFDSTRKTLRKSPWTQKRKNAHRDTQRERDTSSRKFIKSFNFLYLATFCCNRSSLLPSFVELIAINRSTRIRGS